MENTDLIVKFEERLKKLFPKNTKPINKEIRELKTPKFQDALFESWRKKK